MIIRSAALLLVPSLVLAGCVGDRRPDPEGRDPAIAEAPAPRAVPSSVAVSSAPDAAIAILGADGFCPFSPDQIRCDAACSNEVAACRCDPGCAYPPARWERCVSDCEASVHAGNHDRTFVEIFGCWQLTPDCDDNVDCFRKADCSRDELR